MPQTSRRARMVITFAALLAAGTAMSATSVSGADLRIGGTGGALETMRLLGDEFTKVHPDTKVTVLPSLGSGGGIKAVLTGSIQVGVSARPLEDKERALGASEMEYGRTPVVFVVPASSKVSSINVEELVAIYAGKRDKWPDGTKIRIVLRPKGDSDSELVKNISPAVAAAKTAAEARPGMLFAVTDQDNADNLQRTPGSFGTMTLAQIITEKHTMRPLSFNGVKASPKALADGSYPLHKRLFLVLRANPTPEAQRFVAFAQSKPGQAILARTGHQTPATR